MAEQKRSIKNVLLTRRYHWPYVGNWLVLNILLVVGLQTLVMLTLRMVPTTALPVTLNTAIALSVLAAILVVIGLSVLALVWANRIAGVHIRTERVLREVADGDMSVRLSFRASDQLEDVEDSFNAMMSRLQRKESAPESLTRESDNEGSRERRTWRNMQQTSRYHWRYMAVWICVSVGLLISLYGGILVYAHARYFFGRGLDLNLVIVVATLLTVVASGLAIFNGFKTAHRLAGVHIKLIQTFDRVGHGQTDVELKFRAYDKMEGVEDAWKAFTASLAG